MTPSKLSAAMLAAQAEMKNPGFNATNPHFKSKYASLPEVRSVVLPVLAKHGILYRELPLTGDGKAGVEWSLEHVESGDRSAGQFLIPLEKVSAHGVGSALTYARRYCLQTVAGVVAEHDDDGNEASVPTNGGAARFSGPPAGNAPAAPPAPTKPDGNATLRLAAAKGKLRASREAWVVAGKASEPPADGGKAWDAEAVKIGTKNGIKCGENWIRDYTENSWAFDLFVAEMIALAPLAAST